MDGSGSIPSLMLATVWQIVWHNWALTSILITLVLLIVIPSLILLKYVRICLNILRDSEPPLLMAPHGFVPLAGEEIDFYATDGIRLHGTLVRAKTNHPRGLIDDAIADQIPPELRPRLQEIRANPDG